MSAITEQLLVHREKLVSWLHTDLADTLFSSRSFVRPARLEHIAAGEADSFLAFLKDSDIGPVQALGTAQAEEGLGEQAVLRMGATLRRFCHSCLEGDLLRASLEATDAYAGAFLESYIRSREATILVEQERIRAALQRAVSRYLLQLKTAAEVTHAASSVLDLDKLLTSSADLIRERFGFQYVGVFLVDEGGESAILSAGTGTAPDAVLRQDAKVGLGGESSVGACIAQGKALVMVSPGAPATGEDGGSVSETRSAMALPLISRGQAIGAMTIHSSVSGAFSDEDTTGLQTLADHLANAIENARLYAAAQQEIGDRRRAEAALEYLNHRLTALLEVAAGIETTAKRDELPRRLVSALVDRLGYDLVGLWRLDDGMLGQGWQAARVSGGRPRARRVVEAPLKPGIVERALRTGQSVFVPDLSQDPDCQGLSGFRSQICCLLQDVNGLVGVLDVLSVEPLVEADFAVVQAAARLAATALVNARLYEQVQRQAGELEERVTQRTAELAAVNKELEAFAYSVSHDLRAPLRSIDGFSQALLEDYAGSLDASGQDYLHRVRAASQRMGQLIDDLLELSRITRSDLRCAPVHLSALAEAIATELRARDPQRDVQFAIAKGMVAYADARLLRVALENLLDNAWKFTSKHSSARIEIDSVRNDGQMAYYVRDDGAGFDMAYSERLFGPFQRLHAPSQFEGTGVGLATVQRIIARHGGRIWADGAVERGATFYFTLPGALDGKESAKENIDGSE
jgi:signal transduction histidine kinase